MKKVLLGLGWFVLLWIGLSFAGGAIAGGIAGAKTRGYTEGATAGRAAGEEFGRQYGGIILLSSAALALVGTVTGVLPGTSNQN
jgi:hypothetical protein